MHFGLATAPATRTSSTQLWIPLGAGLFILALAVSAAVVPQLRLLHFLQALIYVAVILLARRNNVWGMGAGVFVAAVWNTLQIGITHLAQVGAVVLWHFVSTGQVRRPDTMMVPIGTLGHFILIFGCLAAVVGDRTTPKKWWKFAGGGLLGIAYFACIVAIALPR